MESGMVWYGMQQEASESIKGFLLSKVVQWE